MIGKLTRQCIRPSSHAKNRSQSSLLSNGSDQGTRHLALVFFDILVLDSKSLLWEPYSKRRALLESIVQQRPGYAMLADQVPILMTCKDEAEDDLIHIFAQLQANHQEGAVLKADESKYNDYSLRWVKVRHRFIRVGTWTLIHDSLNRPSLKLTILKDMVRFPSALFPQ